ncbi:MAG: type II secretion system F family protein [Planctomycetota bacterium]|nr:type II secretion system F family protein [Planctomycetota bacterium]
MPDFAYIARDVTGNRTSGVVTAASEREAISTLGSQALFPIEVKADEPRKTYVRRRRIGGQMMVTTYGQLAALLRSGVSLLRSLSVIREQTSHPGLATVLEEVHNRVEDGASLADAMGRHPEVFSEMAISMVRAGGEGGFLEEALDRVAAFSDRQEELRSRVLGALAYPVFLIVLCTIVVTGLLIFFVPNFEEMFSRLRERGELPIATDLLLWFSSAMQSWGWTLLLALLVLGIFARRWIKTPEGRHRADAVKLRIPVGGTIFQSLAISRFCRVLGTLLRNGVPILRSLEIGREATGNRILSSAISDASENISAGAALAEPLGRCDYFPRDVVEIIAVAEEANTLDTVLVDIADRLDRNTTRRLDLLVRLIEPIMLLILAGIVLIIVIALLLPVLKMSSTI